MKKLTNDQKRTFWQKVEQLVGLSAEEPVLLAEYVAKDGSTITVDDETQAVTGAENGEVELEDGRILIVADGKLESIQDAPATEEEAAAEDAPVAPDPAVGDEQAAQIEALTAELEALKAQVAELLAAAQTLTATNTELTTKLAAVEAAPADRKVVLNAQSTPNTTTPGASAWARYQAKK